jgi:hypothetical protein
MRRIRNGQGGKIISIVIVMRCLIQIVITRKIAFRSFWWFRQLTTRNLCGRSPFLGIQKRYPEAGGVKNQPIGSARINCVPPVIWSTAENNLFGGAAGGICCLFDAVYLNNPCHQFIKSETTSRRQRRAPVYTSVSGIYDSIYLYSWRIQPGSQNQC